jgi:hypothetical protein
MIGLFWGSFLDAASFLHQELWRAKKFSEKNGFYLG